MVCELAQAGLEGGSPRLIREHWGLADYGEMQDYWLAVAPPPHISISLIAGALGIDFDRLGPSEEMAQLEPDSGPSIAELAALAPPALVGDAPALLLDDVAPPLPERPLLHLLNHLAEQRRFVLITGREPPARWPVALADLASRLAALPQVAIGAPDDALLAAVMSKLFRDRQLQVGVEVVDYVLPRMERSLSAAQGLVAALDRAALAGQRPITVALARTVLTQTE